jgi:H+/Cl- antiporter ClcA
VDPGEIDSSRPSRALTSAFGGLVGGLAGAALIIVFTQMLKDILAVISGQAPWVLIVAPQIGLGLSVLVLYGVGLKGTGTGAPAETPEERPGAMSRARARFDRWRTFAPGVARSDLTGDMVAFAGEEERFPWRLAPMRALAIVATVGLGAPLGTEAPAAYLGLAAGAAVGDRGRRWRRILRSAAVGGGAAGVAALMGIPLVGVAYILELGRRHDAPLSLDRVVAALVGGLVGWLLNAGLHVDLFRLVVPKEPPHSLAQGVITVFFIGTLSGAITAVTGAAIYRAKAWKAHPALRLALGGLALCAVAVAVAFVAAPTAAVGPGGGAISWVENSTPAATTVLVVAVLRAAATTAAAAAGGCGGLFVPFLAVGDLGGRVFSRSVGIPDDLAGAAGAASGIAGGYHLPFTAITVVLGQGGPHLATLICLATVIVAGFVGTGVQSLLDRFAGLSERYIAKRAPSH